MRHSKILIILTFWFGYVSLTGVYDAVTSFGEKSIWHDTQSILGTIFSTAYTVGLYFQKRWILWLYLVVEPFMLAASIMYFKYYPPDPKYASTVVVAIVLITVVPAILMWIRRDCLTAGALGASDA